MFYCADSMSEDGTTVLREHRHRRRTAQQTILAYDLNDAPLPVPNGAPIRLRVERQLGYKHAKYITAIALVRQFRRHRRRQGWLLGGPGLPVVGGDLGMNGVNRMDEGSYDV